jgi:hypothetical protein
MGFSYDQKKHPLNGGTLNWDFTGMDTAKCKKLKTL